MAYKKNWDDFFTLLDANKSNTITPEDAVHSGKQLAALLHKSDDAPEVQALVKEQKSFLTEFIKSFDTNKDGQVTREELHKGVEKHFVGKNADQFPAFWRHHVAEGFRISDLNKNGDLSLEEVTKMVKNTSPQATDEQIKAAFNYATKHSAGKFDLKAWEHVLQEWATSDKEATEVHLLTGAFRPRGHAGGHGGQYRKNWDDYFTLLDANKSNTITPEDATHLTKKFAQNLHKPEDAPEVQACVKVSKDFLTQFIKSFDTNKDGQVTRQELHAGVQKNFVGKSADQFPAFWKQHIAEGFHHADANKNGDISLEETLKLVKGADPHAKEDDIKAAFAWVTRQSPSGKFDVKAYEHVVYLWATSEKEIPEVQTLTATFRPAHH